MPTLNAKDIAERYAGRIVKCQLTNNSDPKSPVTDSSGQELKTYEARIVGWKQANFGYYVCVELVGGAISQTKLAKFNSGYTYTFDRNLDGFGKKLHPNEIILPADGGVNPAPRKGKEIPEWPHKCRDCQSPAQILGMNIDCSNPSCKHKYRTQSGMDLFLPKEMRLALAKPKTIQKRDEIDKDGILVCPIIYASGTPHICGNYLQTTTHRNLSPYASVGILNMECIHTGKMAHLMPHQVKITLVKGDKIMSRTGHISTYDGKKFI